MEPPLADLRELSPLAGAQKSQVTASVMVRSRPNLWPLHPVLRTSCTSQDKAGQDFPTETGRVPQDGGPMPAVGSS